MFKLKYLAVLFISLLLLSACGDSDSAPETPNVTLTTPEGAAYLSGETVSIGTASNVFGLNYQWEQLEGTPVVFDETATALSFVAPVVTTFEDLLFRLTVTDSTGLITTVQLLRVRVSIDFAAIIADIVATDFMDTANAAGFLAKDIPDGSGIYKWTRADANAYNNITAPIAHFLHVAGAVEAANLGFEEMWIRTNQDPTDFANFNSADLGVILYAYEVTGDLKYLTLAQAMWPSVQAKYAFSASFPREILPNYPGLWGYDAYNYLFNLFMADKYQLENADIVWADQVAIYEGELAGRIATDAQVAIFTNLIFDQMGVGSRDDSNTFVPGTDIDLQYTAYALMSNSVAPNAALEYLLAHVDDVDNVSEAVAEALAAMAPFKSFAKVVTE